MSHRLLAAVLFVAACSTACSGPSAPPEVKSDLARDTDPAISDADFATQIAANNAFAAALYQQQRGATATTNFVMSPYSVSSALAMAYAGAATDTATQMATALDFALPAATVHAAFDRLDLQLAGYASAATAPNTKPFELHIANSIWGQHGLALEAPFLDTLATDYDAGVYELEFATDPTSALDTINSWVASQTADNIQNLLQPGDVTSDTKVVLTDAIYFDAGWAQPFDPNATQAVPFHAPTGDVDVAMMFGSNGYDYASGDRYQAVRLHYANAPTSMIAILPRGLAGDTTDPLTAFEATLDGSQLASIVAGLASTPVNLGLPKFDIASPFELTAALQALGMTDAFDPSTADFSGVDGQRDLFISHVIHQGMIHVDENGTVAAAATAVVEAGGAAPDPNAVTVTFDQPFLYLIQDDTSGQILFMGRVATPVAN